MVFARKWTQLRDFHSNVLTTIPRSSALTTTPLRPPRRRYDERKNRDMASIRGEYTKSMYNLQKGKTLTIELKELINKECFVSVVF